MTRLGFLVFRFMGGAHLGITLVISAGLFVVVALVLFCFDLPPFAQPALMLIPFMPVILFFVLVLLNRTDKTIDIPAKDWAKTSAILYILLSRYGGCEEKQVIRLTYDPFVMYWFNGAGDHKTSPKAHIQVSRVIYDTLRQQGGMLFALRHAPFSFSSNLAAPSAHQYLALRAQHPFCLDERLAMER